MGTWRRARNGKWQTLIYETWHKFGLSGVTLSPPYVTRGAIKIDDDVCNCITVQRLLRGDHATPPSHHACITHVEI
jgi:hypothetical protein